MLKIKTTIVGTAPLLQNRFPEEEHPEVERKLRKKIFPAQEEAENKLYKNGDVICQPARHFEAAMIKAATNFKFEGKKSYKEAFKGGIFINPSMIPHKYKKWEIDRQPVVVQKARIMRARPRFDKWELTFEIQVIDDRIDENIVKEALTYAGLYKGIGDLRPRYGRFEVKEFKVIK